MVKRQLVISVVLLSLIGGSLFLLLRGNRESWNEGFSLFSVEDEKGEEARSSLGQVSVRFFGKNIGWVEGVVPIYEAKWTDTAQGGTVSWIARWSDIRMDPPQYRDAIQRAFRTTRDFENNIEFVVGGLQLLDRQSVEKPVDPVPGMLLINAAQIHRDFWLRVTGEDNAYHVQSAMHTVVDMQKDFGPRLMNELSLMAGEPVSKLMEIRMDLQLRP